MNEILDLRRQVLVGHLTHDRMKDVKRHITARLDWGNDLFVYICRQLGLDLVPRKEYAMVDPEEISITELYRLMEHRHRKKDTPVPASSHHLFVQMKSLMCSNLGEDLEISFSLFDSKENRPISNEACGAMVAIQGLRILVKVTEPEPMEVEEGDLLLQTGTPATPLPLLRHQ
ncbi:hypothetical protein Chor_010265 [Crotalus horridus]